MSCRTNEPYFHNHSFIIHDRYEKHEHIQDSNMDLDEDGGGQHMRLLLFLSCAGNRSVVHRQSLFLEQ